LKKFELVAETIRERIQLAEYKPGEKIPSIRELAEEFDCNKLTVKKSLNILSDEGLLRQHVGKGTFVSFPSSLSNRNTRYNFYSSYINESLLNSSNIQKTWKEAYDQAKLSLFGVSGIAGYPPLIHTLSNRYNLPEDRMIIISGAQQGLDLTSKVFNLNVASEMLFENPTYSGAISVFHPQIFVSMEDDGPNLDEITPAIWKKIRLFYTMPGIHNPTGIHYSLEKKRQIAKLAEKYNFMILEDDYLSEFSSFETPRFVDIIPNRTIYVKSFSKVTAPGIRLGLLIVPDSLKRKYLEQKFSSDIGSPNMMQIFLHQFITNGSFDEHLSRCIQISKDRREKLISVLQQFDYIKISNTRQGYNLWCSTDKPLEDNKVPWTPGEKFSFSLEFRNYFRISFMSLTEKQFNDGLIYIQEILSQSDSTNYSLIF
jgi:DNA-binding transcriptional MocR family regulator